MDDFLNYNILYKSQLLHGLSLKDKNLFKRIYLQCIYKNNIDLYDARMFIEICPYFIKILSENFNITIGEFLIKIKEENGLNFNKVNEILNNFTNKD